MQTKVNEIENLPSILTDIWGMLDESEQQIIKNDARIVHFKKNEIIYSHGEIPTDLLVLCEGQVKIFNSGVGGRTQIVRMIKPIEYFGYRAYFAGESFITAASAFENSTVCMVSMDIVKKLIATNSKLASFFIRLLSVDLGIADQRIVNLTQKHIRGRLAETLIFLRENYGLEDDGATINVYLAREDLANLSNMTTSNAIRTLSAFVEEKIIALNGRKIKIIDEQKLRKISTNG